MHLMLLVSSLLMFVHQLPAPKDISDEELCKLLEAEDPLGFRIPMSLGEPHAELDQGTLTSIFLTTDVLQL